MSTLTDFLKLIKPTRLEKYSVNILNSNFEAVDAGVQEATSRAGKIVAYGPSMQVNNPRKGDYIALFRTMTLEGGRLYRFVFEGIGLNEGASGYWRLGLFTSATNSGDEALTGLTPFGHKHDNVVKIDGANINQSYRLEVFKPLETTTTAKFKVRVWNTVGGGNIQVLAGHWYMEDMGPI